MQKQKHKKILEISSYPPPRAGWGIRVSFVKKALIEQGHACKVLNIAPESRKIPSPEYLTSMNGLDYVSKIFLHCIKGYRVHMHLNGDSPKGFILTLLAEGISLLTFKRADLTFHAGPYQKYFPQERAPKLTPMYKLIFRLARKIICNSDAVKEKIKGYGVPSDKIIPIPAFSRQYLQFEPQDLKPPLNAFITERKPIISSYVFFRPEFFIDRMIEGIAQVVKEYPRLGLLILGSDDGSEKIKTLVNKLGITQNVFFTGDLDHDTFLTILSKSDIFLRTPVKDGVSSSVLEALALGVPVVASENNTRPPSVITYNHEDISEMARILTETIANLEQVKKKVIKPQIRDTVADEIRVLTSD